MPTTSMTIARGAPSTPTKQILSRVANPGAPFPVKQLSTPNDSPGTWRHPRLEEITRRKGATTFTERNISIVAYNIGALLLLWLIRFMARHYQRPQLVPASVGSYVLWAYVAAAAIPVINIALALIPLLRKPDDLSDIPLTPAQRALLGLPPSPSPIAPGTAFSTPPRYSRTPPLSGSIGSRRSNASSPLSGRGSPAAANPPSPFLPSTPLEYKSEQDSMRRIRRSSMGSPTALGAVFPDAGGIPGPGKSGKRTSVALNSKWLYERSRRASGSEWMY